MNGEDQHDRFEPERRPGGIVRAGTKAPYSYFPYFVIVWLAVGLVIVLAVPGLAGRVRDRLAEGDNTEVFVP